MKIVHLIAPAPAGGAESAVRSLAGGLRAAGRDVEVMALLQPYGAHPFVEGLRDEGIPVTELRHRHRAYLAQIRDVSARLRGTGPALLHTHVYHADAIGFVATRRLGIPWVATLHGFTGGGLRNRAYAAGGLQLLRRSHAVICVSENVRVRALRARIAPGRIHLIPNGYLPVTMLDRAAARDALGINSIRPVVGWIGRLSHEKGADLLLDALASAEAPDVTAVLIGDGPERQALEEKAGTANARGTRIVFAGRISNAARLLWAFDAVVLSSRTEGTPMVLLEAMAAGVPVVTFAVGGIPGVVSDESAFLAPPGDVAALARGIHAAVGDGAAAQQRIRRAQQTFAARYAVEQCVALVSRLYDAVTRETGARTR